MQKSFAEVSENCYQPFKIIVKRGRFQQLSKYIALNDALHIQLERSSFQRT